jgi:hypothetical protein
MSPFTSSYILFTHHCWHFSGEYAKFFDFLKSKSIKVKTSGKGGGQSGLNFDDDVDHHLEKVKADAMELGDSGDSMSSDDSDFNPDNLEALSAKEEYDSEPSTTSGEEESDGGESGEEAEKRREERRKKKEEKMQRKQKHGKRKNKIILHSYCGAAAGN